MAHFAKIDENNIVVDIVVVPNDQEHRGNDYLNENGFTGTWIQTSYNTQGGFHFYGEEPLRGNYAKIGGIYDPELDAFYSQKPKEYMVLNTTTFRWEYPIPRPTDFPEGKFPKWNEELMDWDIIDLPIPNVPTVEPPEPGEVPTQ